MPDAFYIRHRQRGKTTDLVDWTVNAPNRVMVVHDLAEADRVTREFAGIVTKPFRDQPRNIVSIGQISNGTLRGVRDLHLGLDNLDLYIDRLLGMPGGTVRVITATGVNYD